MRRATGRALLRSSLLGYVRGLEEMEALALTGYTHLHEHFNMGRDFSRLVATDVEFPSH